MLSQYTELIEVRDDEGCTPLLGAFRNGNYVLAKILLSYGANPLVKDVYGNTITHLSALQNNLELLDLAINHHAPL
ncbi:MAG: hypothetical protein CUN55_20065, partial [Phototrophicales bacterium]